MRRFGLLIISMSAANVTPAVAQRGPDTLVNVQVLSKDMSAPRSHEPDAWDHVGPGRALRTLPRRRAGTATPNVRLRFRRKTDQAQSTRYRMVMAINGEHLAGLDDRADPPIEVNCATCHRGLRRPVTLAGEITRVYGEEGADAAVTYYHTLRERYYGSWSYDFGESSLNRVAQQLARSDDWDGALIILNLNKEFFPESSAIHASIGQAYMEKGNNDLAVQNLERALELNSQNRMARRLLRGIRNDER